MLRAHRCLEAYCANLWWRWLVFFVFTCNEAPVEWNWQGKTEVLGEKPVPVPLCPPQIPHGLTRDRTSIHLILPETYHDITEAKIKIFWPKYTYNISNNQQIYEVCDEGFVRRSTPTTTAKTPIISDLNSYSAMLYTHKLFLGRLHRECGTNKWRHTTVASSWQNAERQGRIYFTGTEQSNGTITTLASKRCQQFDRFISRPRWKNRWMLLIRLYIINTQKLLHLKDRSSQKNRAYIYRLVMLVSKIRRSFLTHVSWLTARWL